MLERKSTLIKRRHQSAKVFSACDLKKNKLNDQPASGKVLEKMKGFSFTVMISPELFFKYHVRLKMPKNFRILCFWLGHRLDYLKGVLRHVSLISHYVNLVLSIYYMIRNTDN